MKTEKGQAFAEYMPTIAGFMALAFAVFYLWVTPLIVEWYETVWIGFDCARQVQFEPDMDVYQCMTKEKCNRGVGNLEEGCDPGNSGGQGKGGGRPAGEDRSEDKGPPGQNK